MSKRLCIVLALILLTLLPLTTYADVVHGNEFYSKHPGKTQPVGEFYQNGKMKSRGSGKVFVINSPAGFVIPRDEPGSASGIPSKSGYRSGWGYQDIKDPTLDVFAFENGEMCVIEATYIHNDQYWGVMAPSHRYQPSGWILMDDLLVVFDRQDFEIQNQDHFYAYTGSYDAVLSAKKLVLWQWPGSDREKKVTDYQDTIQKCGNVLYAYLDAEGREWGKSEYAGAWICLSDPENDKIPAFYPAPSPAKWSADGNHHWADAATATYPPQAPSK